LDDFVDIPKGLNLVKAQNAVASLLNKPGCRPVFIGCVLVSKTEPFIQHYQLSVIMDFVFWTFINRCRIFKKYLIVLLAVHLAPIQVWVDEHFASCQVESESIMVLTIRM
jgi:hypothetical protein